MTPVTPSFDDDERALARALHGRVDHMNESPLGFQDVSATAHGIRRRRRVAAAAGIAAAAVVLVPAVIAAGGLFDDKPAGPPVMSQSASPSQGSTPSESPTATPELPTSQVLDVSGLVLGDGPLLAWAELDYVQGVADGGTIHGTDGTDTPLPSGSLRQLAPLGDGYVVDMGDSEGNETVYVLDRDGRTGDPYEASGGIAVSPGGNVVAWTAPDGTVSAAHGETGDVLTLRAVPGPGPYRTIGVTTEDCKEGRSNDGGCTVFVTSNGRKPAAYYTTSHGIVDRLPGLMNVSASDLRRVGGMTSVDESEPGSCSRMLQDFETELWETCDNSLGPISPDGSLMIGLPDYLDGFGPNSMDLLDMTDGTPVRSWTSNARSATFFDEVWEDAGHVLVVTYQGGDWAMVRLGVDGSMEYAVAPVAASDYERPFVVALR